MNTFEVVGQPAVPAMYPGFGALLWRSSGGIPSQLRQLIESGVRSSTTQTETPLIRTALPRTPAVTPVIVREQTTADRRAAASRIAVAEQKAASLLLRSRLPLEMQQRIQRSVAEVEIQRPVIAARKEAEAEVEAKRTSYFAAWQKPAENAGIRAWEAYYIRTSATGTPINATMRRKYEKPEKDAFARATGPIQFIPTSFTEVSGLGVRRGVTWMFPVAYGLDSMPYWDLWFDNKATAYQIGQKVAADYTSVVTRRANIQRKYRAEREAWQDAGKPGSAPTVGPSEGVESALTAPVVTSPTPRMTITPQRTATETPAIPRQQAAVPVERKAEAARQRVLRPWERPADDAGIEAWQAYSRATKKRLSPAQWARIEKAEKAAVQRPPKVDLPPPGRRVYGRPVEPVPSLNRPAPGRRVYGRPVEPLPSLRR